MSTKILRQEDLHEDYFDCVDGKIVPVSVCPAFNCNDLGFCNLNSIGNVVAPTPTAGQVLLYDGSNWVSSDIITSGGGGVFSKTFTIADWGVAPYSITILATEHGLGLQPLMSVTTYQDLGTDNEDVDVQKIVADNGDVTLSSNVAFDGHVVIIGGGAGIVSSKSTFSTNMSLGLTLGNYMDFNGSFDSVSELAVSSIFDVLRNVTIASVRIVYQDNTGLSTIDGNSILMLRKNGADTGISISIPQPTNTSTLIQLGSNIGSEVFDTNDKMSFKLVTDGATTGDLYIRGLMIDFIIN